MRKSIYPIPGVSVLIFLLLTCLCSSAQTTTGTIKGNVKDPNGHPLSGASVALEGRQGGTVTDAAGNYLLKAVSCLPGSIWMCRSWVKPSKVPCLRSS